MRFVFFAVASGLSLGAATASGVVLHPDAPAVTQHPLSAVITTWPGGSAVAVAPRWFIATRHQGGSTSNNVVFNGQTYDVVERVAIYDPARPAEGFPNPIESDLVLWRIGSYAGGPSTLAAWTPIVSTSLTQSTGVTIGGFGQTRSGAAQVFTNPGGAGTGYAVSGGGSLVWGTNTIDNPNPALFLMDLNADTIPDGRTMAYIADFDGPSGTSEATLAIGDSGGGWFVNDNGWKLLGVSIGVHHPTRAIYSPPESLYAAALPAYAADVLAIINGLPGDFDDSGAVGAGDLNLVLGNWGSGSVPSAWINQVPSGAVGATELNVVLGNWGSDEALHAQMDDIMSVTGLNEAQIRAMIPEPATAALLLLAGTLAAMARRHRTGC